MDVQPEPLRIATRGSPLARWQSDHVATLLRRSISDLSVEVVVIETEGDLDRTRPIAELAGRGVFAKEVQAAVLDGRADVAVHSAKDLMSTPTDGLVIASVLERGSATDALVGQNLNQLAEGAVIATGSVRRQAQLATLRPDLRFVGLRGNIDTRLARIGTDSGLGDGSLVAAVVSATAALERLGIADRIAQSLAPEQMLPQVAQGAVAVECRADDNDTIAALASITELATARCVAAERAYLAELGGGCDLPVGGYAVLIDPACPEGDLLMTALLSSRDGVSSLRANGAGRIPSALGRGLALELLDAGGRELLDLDQGPDQPSS
jgi:hydroxymethylbilane synthase